MLYGALCEIAKDIIDLKHYKLDQRDVVDCTNIDAIFIDVTDHTEWRNNKDFIMKIREQSPCIAFVLIGIRAEFMAGISRRDQAKYNHYYFFDKKEPFCNIPIVFRSFAETAKDWHDRKLEQIKSTLTATITGNSDIAQ